MKQLKEELYNRLEKRRQKRPSAVNLVVKIIIFVLLIMMINFFGNEKESKFRNIFKSFSHKSDTEILK
jgi:predicted PurR-regulated permease PerM